MAKLYHKAAAVILGLIVSSSGCNIETNPDWDPIGQESSSPQDSSSPIEYTPAEYGMPHATFRLDGRVVSAANSEEGIPGIEVSFQDVQTHTDENGAWNIHETWLAPCGWIGPCALEVRDIDGEENGYFRNKEVNLDTTQTKEASGWFEGKFEQSEIIIKLEPIEPAEEE